MIEPSEKEFRRLVCSRIATTIHTTWPHALEPENIDRIAEIHTERLTEDLRTLIKFKDMPPETSDHAQPDT